MLASARNPADGSATDPLGLKAYFAELDAASPERRWLVAIRETARGTLRDLAGVLGPDYRYPWARGESIAAAAARLDALYETAADVSGAAIGSIALGARAEIREMVRDLRAARSWAREAQRQWRIEAVR